MSLSIRSGIASYFSKNPEKAIPVTGVVGGMTVGLISKAVGQLTEMCVEVRGKPSLYNDGTLLLGVNDVNHKVIMGVALLVPIAIATGNLAYKMYFRENVQNHLQSKDVLAQPLKSEDENLTAMIPNRKLKKASVLTQMSIEKSYVSWTDVCSVGLLTGLSIATNIGLKPLKKFGLDPSGHVMLKSAATLGILTAMDYVVKSGQRNFAFKAAVLTAVADAILMANTVGCTHTLADVAAGSTIALGLALTARAFTAKVAEVAPVVSQRVKGFMKRYVWPKTTPEVGAGPVASGGCRKFAKA